MFLTVALRASAGKEHTTLVTPHSTALNEMAHEMLRVIYDVITNLLLQNF